jgi:hypothetical protein
MCALHFGDLMQQTTAAAKHNRHQQQQQQKSCTDSLCVPDEPFEWGEKERDRGNIFN